MKSNKNIFRRNSLRLKSWDYTSPWWYFITINTKNHKPYFGRIVDGNMKLNKLGRLVENELERTRHLRENVDLDYYIVMPTHVHVIIIINPPAVLATGPVADTTSQSSTLMPNSLGSIIGQIKSVCTKKIRELGVAEFAWHRNYYDRIIRNQKELDKIRRYIAENPLRSWIKKVNVSPKSNNLD